MHLPLKRSLNLRKDETPVDIVVVGRLPVPQSQIYLVAQDKLLGFCPSFSTLACPALFPIAPLPPWHPLGKEGRVGLQHQHPVEARQARLQQGVDRRTASRAVPADAAPVFFEGAGRGRRSVVGRCSLKMLFQFLAPFSTGRPGEKTTPLSTTRSLF